MNNKPLRSSREWLGIKYPKSLVVDPDGWDRSSQEALDASWAELITEEEFDKRYNQSTVAFNFFRKGN
jgi:hypothetical protein